MKLWAVKNKDGMYKGYNHDYHPHVELAKMYRGKGHAQKFCSWNMGDRPVQVELVGRECEAA